MLGSGPTVARLFERDRGDRARRKSGEVRDRAAMAALARDLWLNDPGYLADPRQVAQSADLALEIRYLR